MRKYKFANSHMQRAQPFFLQSEVDRLRIIWKSELLSLPNGFLHIASNKEWGGSTGAPLIFGNLGLCKQVHDPLNQSEITSPWFPHLYDTIQFQAHRKKQYFF